MKTNTTLARGQTISWLLVCFVCSGISGLIYEIAWVRSLELIFGATTFAVATVLASFMGGLAFGSYFMGRSMHRLHRFHPLLVYGVLEVLIAGCGLLIPVLLESLIPLYKAIWGQFHTSFVAFSVVRFVLCSLVLLAPTFLMGATLPVVSSFVGSGTTGDNRRIGLLYTFNTAGAVLGCALAGLVLFPNVGLAKTQAVAVVLNVLAAIGAFAITRIHPNRSLRVSSTPSSEQAESKSKMGSGLSKRQVGLLVGIYAISGFCAMLYEVSWSRVLVMVLGSSTYAYTIMLATFLFGLASGAYLASRYLCGNASTMALSGLCQVFIALSTFASVFMVEQLPFLYLQAFELTRANGHGLLLVQFLLAFALMILPTLGLGAMFPLTIQGLNPSGHQTARRVGWAYALNTLGAIGGSLLAGFLLVPHWGSRNTIIVGIVLNALAGLTTLLSIKLDRFARLRPAFALALLAFVGSLVVSPSSWRPYVLSSGMFRYVENYKGLNHQQFEERMRENRGQILYFKEGLTCTVTVCRSATGISLLVNGKPDASVPTDLPNPFVTGEKPRLKEGDLATQVLLGQVPLLLAPKNERVMVIGLGSGVTLGSVLRHPVKQVECIELEDAVVQGSRFFEHYNGKPLQDPRVQLVVNDARNHLLVTDHKYDVIISEPSNPWVAGAASLFTSEFFQTARTKLQPDGIFCQWVQLYELRAEDFQAILRSFTASFPYAHVFRIDMDAIIVGSATENPIRLEDLKQRLTPAVQSELQEIDVQTPEELLAHYWVGGRELLSSLPLGAANSDDNMLIEFAAPLRTLSRDVTAQVAFVREVAGLFRKESTGLLPHLDVNEPETANQAAVWARLGQAALRQRHPLEATLYARHSMSLAPNGRAAAVQGEALLLGGKREEARMWFDQQGAEFGADPEFLRAAANFAQQDNDMPKARALAQRLVAVNPGEFASEFLLGQIFYRLKDWSAAQAVLEPLAQNANAPAELSYYRGASYWSQGHYEEALPLLAGFVERVPNHLDAQYRLADTLTRLGRQSESFLAWQRVAQLRSAYAAHRLREGQKARDAGNREEARAKFRDALEHDPWNEQIYLDLVRLYQQTGDVAAAIQLLEKYLVANPDRPWAVGLLGQLLAQHGNPERAVALASRYQALTGLPWRSTAQ
jgi:spermidine synthase